jgi:hypothetical protein
VRRASLVLFAIGCSSSAGAPRATGCNAPAPGGDAPGTVVCIGAIPATDVCATCRPLCRDGQAIRCLECDSDAPSPQWIVAEATCALDGGR